MPLPDRDKMQEALIAHVTQAEDEAGLGLTGLMGPTVEINDDTSFVADGRFFVRWTLKGNHGGAVAGPRERASIKPQERVLGWLPTGREVSVEIFSTGKEDGAGGFVVEESRWDRLDVLAQIGVRAVGRPITASAEAEFDPDEGDIMIEDDGAATD